MDVFVHDRETGTTQLVSTANDGTQGNGSSGFTVLGTEGIDLAYGPSITSDGKTVVFMSNATNLVSGDSNANQDIFITTH
jgi:Tol biopolymer transport system component